MKAISLILLSIVMLGCLSMERKREVYDYKFNEWQQRQQREGWTSEIVSEIADSVRAMNDYRLEGSRDYWKTYGDWLKDGLRGDCEDTVFAISGTLRRMGYPHGMELVIKQSLLEDGQHAVIRIEMPDGTKRTFESIPTAMIPLNQFAYEILAYPIM